MHNARCLKHPHRTGAGSLRQGYGQIVNMPTESLLRSQHAPAAFSIRGFYEISVVAPVTIRQSGSVTARAVVILITIIAPAQAQGLRSIGRIFAACSRQL